MIVHERRVAAQANAFHGWAWHALGCLESNKKTPMRPGCFATLALDQLGERIGGGINGWEWRHGVFALPSLCQTLVGEVPESDAYSTATCADNDGHFIIAGKQPIGAKDPAMVGLTQLILDLLPWLCWPVSAHQLESCIA